MFHKDKVLGPGTGSAEVGDSVRVPEDMDPKRLSLCYLHRELRLQLSVVEGVENDCSHVVLVGR